MLDDDVLVVLDPNCRPRVTSDRVGYMARLQRMLRRADVVKVSTDDLDFIASEDHAAGVGCCSRAARAWCCTPTAVAACTSTGKCARRGAGAAWSRWSTRSARAMRSAARSRRGGIRPDWAVAISDDRDAVVPPLPRLSRWPRSAALGSARSHHVRDELGNTWSPARRVIELTVDEAIERAAAMAAAGRALLGIAGCPGAGKSTLSEAITAGVPSSVVVPMDGFHMLNEDLVRLGRRDRKGAPDTFDVDAYVALLDHVRRQRPRSSRRRDTTVRPARRFPTRSPSTPDNALVITEGNYLLLDAAAVDRSAAAARRSVVRRGRRCGTRATIDRPPHRVRQVAGRGREWVMRSDEANAAVVAATRDSGRRRGAAAVVAHSAHRTECLILRVDLQRAGHDGHDIGDADALRGDRPPRAGRAAARGCGRRPRTPGACCGEMRMTGRPRSRRCWISLSTCVDSRTPSAAVGSSRMMTLLPNAAARATATACR